MGRRQADCHASRDVFGRYHRKSRSWSVGKSLSCLNRNSDVARWICNVRVPCKIRRPDTTAINRVRALLVNEEVYLLVTFSRGYAIQGKVTEEPWRLKPPL